MDCVFFGRSSGYLVVRDPHHKRNVYWSEIATETMKEYKCARNTLESSGFVIEAVVSDGRPGLKRLSYKMGDLCEKCFTRELEQWEEDWRKFMKERTINPETGKGPFTHKRLRSAFRSLKLNLPYLFTYKRHPELNIPNTTNGLEGSFSYLKKLVRVHRGVNSDLKRKMIVSILQNRPTNL